VSNVTVSMKLSLEATGALYMKSIRQEKRIAELEKGYEELRMATLWAVQLMSGGQAKADLRDAYDKATEQLEALKETK
jgi:replicative DNA helicase